MCLLCRLYNRNCNRDILFCYMIIKIVQNKVECRRAIRAIVLQGVALGMGTHVHWIRV